MTKLLLDKKVTWDVASDILLGDAIDSLTDVTKKYPYWMYGTIMGLKFRDGLDLIGFTFPIKEDQKDLPFSGMEAKLFTNGRLDVRFDLKDKSKLFILLHGLTAKELQ